MDLSTPSTVTSSAAPGASRAGRRRRTTGRGLTGRRRAGLLVLAGVAALAATQPAPSFAAHGAPVSPAGDVFDMAGCTGFAIRQNVVVTAGHCDPADGAEFVSVSGKHVRSVRHVKVPGFDASVVTTDASNLSPFPVGEIDPGAPASVLGLGDSGGVLRLAHLLPGQADSPGHVSFLIEDANSSTTCHGDSGAPVVQGEAAVGILVDGDDGFKGHCALFRTGVVPLQSALA